MSHPFDPGYGAEPFRTLVHEYPEADVYPPGQFRVEWGPIFHRGRLDGTARVLVIGQDPAQHETVVRRILVGEAGRRVQGFLAKLGITRSYVMVNTFLYSVYGSVESSDAEGSRPRRLSEPLARRAARRHEGRGGRRARHAADDAWQLWKATPTGQALARRLRGDHASDAAGELVEGRQAKCRGHEAAAPELEHGPAARRPAIQHPDVAVPWFSTATRGPTGIASRFPERDFPAGLPPWMHEDDGWAQRTGKDELAKRRTITITVPKGIVSTARALCPLDEPRAVPPRRASDRSARGPDAGARRRRRHDGRRVSRSSDAVVYIDKGGIVAVQDRAQPAPAGFDATRRWSRPTARSSRADRAAQPPQLQRAAPLAPCRSASTTAASGAITRTIGRLVSGPMTVVGQDGTAPSCPP